MPTQRSAAVPPTVRITHRSKLPQLRMLAYIPSHPTHCVCHWAVRAVNPARSRTVRHPDVLDGDAVEAGCVERRRLVSLMPSVAAMGATGAITGCLGVQPASHFANTRPCRRLVEPRSAGARVCRQGPGLVPSGLLPGGQMGKTLHCDIVALPPA